MRKAMLNPALFAVSLGLALSAVCLMGGRPAAAQEAVPTNSAPQLDGDIRAGALFSTNNAVETKVGRQLPAAGVDVVIKHDTTNTNLVVSADFIDHSSNGSHLQVIPVTIWQQIFSGNSRDVTRTYTEYGAGLYFVNQSLPDSSGNQKSSNQTAFGGFLGFGVDVTNNIFIDARYHAVTDVNSISASGLEVTGGYRF
jgi:hypothetical protein